MAKKRKVGRPTGSGKKKTTKSRKKPYTTPVTKTRGTTTGRGINRHKTTEKRKSVSSLGGTRRAGTYQYESVYDPRTGSIRTTVGVGIDRKLKAMPPGKRVAKSGNVYYEYRRNRSDRKKKRV